MTKYTIFDFLKKFKSKTWGKNSTLTFKCKQSTKAFKRWEFRWRQKFAVIITNLKTTAKHERKQKNNIFREKVCKNNFFCATSALEQYNKEVWAKTTTTMAKKKVFHLMLCACCCSMCVCVYYIFLLLWEKLYHRKFPFSFSYKFSSLFPFQVLSI